MSENSIHGHAVLHHIQDHGPISRSDLQAWATAQFGTDSKFHACFASGMDFSTLLDALAQRGKISEGPKGFVMGDGADICSDE